MQLVGAPGARPPFGLASWTDGAEAMAVALGATSGDIAAIARQIPSASSLAHAWL
jgi:hypothetical protein